MSLSSSLDSHTPEVAILRVSGLRCAGCVQSLESQLKAQPGVEAAAVNLVTGTAVVTYSPNETTPVAIVECLNQGRFQATLAEANALLELPTASEETSLPRLAIALVLLILSSTGHGIDLLPGHWPMLEAMIWHWGLATIALVLPGWEILQEGMIGLFQRCPNMNTLVALGALGAYLTSTVAWLWPALGWECFFDEPVMILGFILLGRSLEQRIRQQAQRDLQSLLALQPPKALWQPSLESTDRWPIPVQQIQVGDWLWVEVGDPFPADGTIAAGETLVEESLLTGESLPVAKGVGDAVLAGSRNVGAAVTLRVERCGRASFLGQILDLVVQAQNRKAPVQQRADVIAGYFGYGVLALAAATFGFWSAIAPHCFPELSHSTPLLPLKLALNVLVIACPCALGLATPIALLVGTSHAATQGMIIRGGDVLERSQQLNMIVFDKTGTLTTGELEVAEIHCYGEQAAEEVLYLLASLEQKSRHPLAGAIRNAWAACGQPRELATVTAVETALGLGISGWIEGQVYRAGRLSWLRDQGVDCPSCEVDTHVALACDRQLIAIITFRDRLRPEAVSTVQALQAEGYEIHVLTGDTTKAAQQLLEPLGLPPTHLHTELQPQQKLALIEGWQAQGKRVAMVGDGMNDAPALTAAQVGISLGSGTEVAIEAADIILTRNHLADLLTVLELSRATFRKIQQNLLWAVAYNIVGLPLAAGVGLPLWGLSLTPGIAAACMAVSSIAVVLNSLSLRRAN
ncbi:MAG: heavy metal translocating P-type ATPase [Thermosynechococcus sp.]